MEKSVDNSMNVVSVLDEIELLEHASTGKDVINFYNYIILPNLQNIDKSNSFSLSHDEFATYIDYIIFNINQYKAPMSLYNFNKYKTCFLNSEYHTDYYIEVDFLNYNYNIPFNFRNNVSGCIYDSDVRCYVIPLRLIINKKFGHANVVIVDTESKTIEFFEPHGILYSGNEKEEINLYNLQNHIVNILNYLFDNKIDISKYNYKNVQETCIIGLQTLQNQSDANTGHCLAWILLFIHVKLYNPSLPSNDIITFFINRFTNYELDSYIKRYIRHIEAYYYNQDQFNTAFVKKRQYNNLISFTLTQDEETKIENKISLLTFEFKKEKKIEERKKILERLLMFENYPNPSNKIFSDLI